MVKQLHNMEDYHGADEYLLWHRELGSELLAYDVDVVEWRIRKQPVLLPSGNGGVERILTPVATMELTRVSTNSYAYLRDKTLEIILMRFRVGLQGRTAIYLAEKLGVACYIVAFEEGLQHLSVKEITNDGINQGSWVHMTQSEYVNWLENL